jgi:predicted transposase/invertase (TIGR01784 family)
MAIAQKLEQIGREQGLEQGRLQGEQEATRKIVHAMLQNNMDDVTVMKITGISEDELNQTRRYAL